MRYHWTTGDLAFWDTAPPNTPSSATTAPSTASSNASPSAATARHEQFPSPEPYAHGCHPSSDAGIVLSADSFTSPSAVMGGVGAALIAGKLIGVTLFSWVAVRLGFGRLPEGARWGHVMGVGAFAGIGFTVSLFITGLAFDDVAIQADAKIGILAASIIAALAGAAILAAAARPQGREAAGDDDQVSAAN